MDRTYLVINALDDAQNQSIEYSNRFWLRENVNKLQISVSIAGCIIDEYYLSRELKEGNVEFFVQNGKIIFPRNKENLNMDKELLVFTESLFENVKRLVFLFRPKN